MIRNFTPSDMDSILAIEQEAFPKAPFSRSIFQDFYINENVTFLVFEKDSGILGDMVFEKNGHAVTLAVAGKHRRSGIAAALMKRALELISGPFLFFEVRKSNLTAKELYRHLGAYKAMEKKGYYSSPSEDAEIWVLSKSGKEALI